MKRSHYFILMALIILGLYCPLILNGQLTTYDDQLLVNSIKMIKHFKDYVPAVLNGGLLDVQPVRDLSFQVDLWLSSLLGRETFYFTNALLLFFLGLLLVKVLERERGPLEMDHFSYLLALVFITSPLVMSSAGWVAARKHLLAALFILLATYYLLKKKSKNRDGLIVLFYVLSMFSQPINLFWPFFAIAHEQFIKKENNKKLFVSLFIALLFFLILNVVYYKGVFVKISAGDGKFEGNGQLDLGLSLLALGRYFFTALDPFDYLPTSFFQGAWENILGLIALVIFIYWMVKKSKRNWPYALLFLVPLLPVTLSITRIFASQTYLLSSLPGLLLIFRSMENERVGKVIALLYIGLNLLCSVQYASVLGESDRIYRFAYEKEKTPLNIVGAIAADIKEHKHREAEKKIDELVIFDPQNRFIPFFRVQNIYADPDVKGPDKVLMLEKSPFDVPYYYLVLSLLYANEGRSDDFKKTILKVYESPEKYIHNSYLDNERALALYRITCEKFHYEDQCKKVYLEFSRKTQLKNWDPEKYARVYKEMSNGQKELIY